MKKTTICRHCRFPRWKSSKHTGAIGAQTLTRVCMSPDAPIHDFVEGLSLCDRLNHTGACKFFRPIKERESEG